MNRDEMPFAAPCKTLSLFAPFGWVFPRAGLIIHHGGLNTTGEALRAGVPSLVIPHAYDQFDKNIPVQIKIRPSQLMNIMCSLKINTANSAVSNDAPEVITG